MSSPGAQRGEALTIAEQLHNRLRDESALMEDLLVHIQNVTLGNIVGQTVPFRQPLDPNVPRIVANDGQLQIVEGPNK